jgi:flagellar basal body-associated protein FliL
MHKDTCKGLIDARKATIRDRLDTLLRNADPKYLNEPGLETLRRQIKFELDKVFKDEKLVDEILITKFLKSRANL